MTYAHQVCRVTLSGTMFGGSEVWSTGFFLGEEGSDSSAPTQEDADTIATNFRNWFRSLEGNVNWNYLFTMVKMQSINAVDGKPVLAETVYANVEEPRAGQEQNILFPPQCSLVVSLLSDRPRGKASHGRLYLPGIGVALTAGGRISQSDVTDLRTSLAGFFQPMITAGYLDAGRLILAAKASGAGGLNPSQNDYVQKIRVGDVVDTQRRRRNGLHEAYQESIL